MVGFGLRLLLQCTRADGKAEPFIFDFGSVPSRDESDVVLVVVAASGIRPLLPELDLGLAFIGFRGAEFAWGFGGDGVGGAGEYEIVVGSESGHELEHR